jgi:hypothetical protein
VFTVLLVGGCIYTLAVLEPPNNKSIVYWGLGIQALVVMLMPLSVWLRLRLNSATARDHFQN